ncbi:hypothetical protein L596_022869 [Steinernema carpocapsae]|uniref:Uncharacterized protein n=1 Tax=Steinernema carpocapsae TaxID=34508 RepID=A0A4V5ZZ84_STECR|nr:hypothetical protein L596_022869 [Steinernema carpocapsae]
MPMFSRNDLVEIRTMMKFGLQIFTTLSVTFSRLFGNKIRPVVAAQSLQMANFTQLIRRARGVWTKVFWPPCRLN